MPRQKPAIRHCIPLLLIVSVVLNVFLLVIVAAAAVHYRWFEKAQRILMEEGRVPGVTFDFRMKRQYDAARALFNVYEFVSSTVLLVGDSLTAEVNWLELVPEVSVAARGIPGDTSAGLRHRLSDYDDLDVSLAMIWIGTNDVQHRMELDEMIANIAHSARYLAESGRKVALVSIPPVASFTESAESKNKLIREANDELRTLAQRNDFIFVDCSKEWSDENGFLKGAMTRDGVHLSAEGYLPLRTFLRDWANHSLKTGQP